MIASSRANQLALEPLHLLLTAIQALSEGTDRSVHIVDIGHHGFDALVQHRCRHARLQVSAELL